MKMYGHADVAIMNGGRKKWLSEGRDVSTDVPTPAPATYTASGPDNALRGFLDQVQSALQARSHHMVDVRSPQEFTGEILAPPGLPETCQRGATFRTPATSPGAKPVMTTARSSPPTSCGLSTGA